jgi:hypothetical protein
VQQAIAINIFGKSKTKNYGGWCTMW